MNREKLQILISAGVFSAVLLSGAAYADDKTTDTNQVQVSTPTPDTSNQAAPAAKPSAKQKKSDKDAAQSGCGGANGCGGH